MLYDTSWPVYLSCCMTADSVLCPMVFNAYFSQVEAVVGIFDVIQVHFFLCVLITGSFARECGERTGNCNCYLCCLTRQSVSVQMSYWEVWVWGLRRWGLSTVGCLLVIAISGAGSWSLESHGFPVSVLGGPQAGGFGFDDTVVCTAFRVQSDLSMLQ